MQCPACNSKRILKNGSIHNGKSKCECKDCGRQFVVNPENVIPQQPNDLIDKLLPERISQAGIARAAGVPERWLQDYVNQKYESIPQEIEVTGKPRGKITIQCDEMRSFVLKSKNKYWIWPAADAGTREIAGVFAGSRDREGSRGLWNSLPPVCRQCAVCHADFWEACNEAFPSSRHKAAGKESGKTNRIERVDCTMRQRISRLVRKTLSFSKKAGNRIGAIWHFIHHYNSCLPVAC